MNKNIISAAFDDRIQAERAVADLRSAGVPDRAISVIARHGDETVARTGAGDADRHNIDDKGSGTAKGLGVGAGVGAVAGLAALLIPGVGPFFAAGAVAETLGLVGSSVVTSAAVGAAAGGLTGALMKYGVSEEEARHYDRRINEGAVFVGVDTDHAGVAPQTVRDMLYAAGGRSASVGAAPGGTRY